MLVLKIKIQVILNMRDENCTMCFILLKKYFQVQSTKTIIFYVIA